MPHYDLDTARECRDASARRRHTEVAPHVLALLDRAQHGDRDAFAALFLLTELPSAVPPD